MQWSISITNTVWVKKSPLRFCDSFPKRLGLFRPNFTCLLCILIYAILRNFVQLSATLTKLCHIKCDHRTIQRAFRSMVDILSTLWWSRIWTKSSQPFGKKMSENFRGIFLTQSHCTPEPHRTTGIWRRVTSLSSWEMAPSNQSAMNCALRYSLHATA